VPRDVLAGEDTTKAVSLDICEMANHAKQPQV
jgi:hypothetical protein